MTRAPRRRLVADEYGATSIEYALLAALIAGVLIGTVASMGQSLNEAFDNATQLVDGLDGDG